MPLNAILNEIDELGARIDALSALGASLAAALSTEAIRSIDVQNMLSTYASGLLAVQRRIRTAVSDVTADFAPATPVPGWALAYARPQVVGVRTGLYGAQEHVTRL